MWTYRESWGSSRYDADLRTSRGSRISAAAERPFAAAEGAAVAPALAAVHGIEQAVRAALDVLATTDAGQVGREEGMDLQTALRCWSGAGGNDGATLLAAADVLRRMPVLAALYRAGGLSWSHLRQVVYGLRRCARTQVL